MFTGRVHLCFHFFPLELRKRITQYIHGEKKHSKVCREKKHSKLCRAITFFLFYGFGYLFLVMSYLGDRRHKWQTTANSAEPGSRVHEIWWGLCSQLRLISETIIQELSHTEPACLQWPAGCIQIISRGWGPWLQVTQVQDGKSGSSNSVFLLLVLNLSVCFQFLVNERRIQ